MSRALVMELVEGEDLSQRIARGAMPLDEALPIAKQIAEALEAAHDQGIIHRDLKPANIKVRSDGTVKVLDFGLAKAMEGAGEAGEARWAGGNNLTQSPTITTPAMTQAGMILGTAAYMSPEQAKGRPADKRSDVWALGCVLCEMLTGTRVFLGEDVPDTLAAVLRGEPDWAALPASTPAPIRKLLRRCLEKDRKRRLADAADARLEIEEALSAPASADNDAARFGRAPSSAWGARALPWVVAASTLALSIASLLLWAPWRTPVPTEQPLMELEISSPEGTSFGPVTQRTSAAVSPDGRQLVLIAGAKGGTRMLWHRLLASNSPRVLPGTENPSAPSWSPDGRWVQLHSGRQAQEGQSWTAASRKSSWTPPAALAHQMRSGVTLFADVGKPVQRVATAGGTPAPVFELDESRGEIAHNNPQFLPDGNHFLYNSNARESGPVFASLDGKTRRFLFAIGGNPAHYAPNPAGGAGWLLYYRTNQLLARPFDPIKGKVIGEPVPIADSVSSGPTWSVSNNGVLMFRHFRPSQTQLTWFSRDGNQLGVVGEAGTIDRPRISPDEQTVSFSRTRDGNSDVWLVNLARNAPTRVTLEPGADQYAVWSADGRRLFYFSRRQNEYLVVERRANGLGEERIVLTSSSGASALAIPTGASKDGKWLAFSESGAGQTRLVAPLAGRRQVCSRDRDRIGIQRPCFPRWQMASLRAHRLRSQGGCRANAPQRGRRFGGRGKMANLVFRRELRPCGVLTARRSSTFPQRAHSSPCPSSPDENSFQPGTPQELFRTRDASNFDVTADGKRFLVNQPVSDSSDTPVTVILNWPQLLKK